MSRLRHRLVRQKEFSSAGPAQARSAVATPFLIRSLQKRLAGREVGVFDLELPDGSTHRVGGEAARPRLAFAFGHPPRSVHWRPSTRPP